MIALVRQAQAADAAGLKACIEAAYAPFAHLCLPDVSAGIAEDIEAHHVWVQEDADVIGGGIIVSLNGTVAHLNNLAVHPDHAGKGIGSALIRMAVSDMRAQGAHEMRLATHIGMPQNLGLYRHLGWAETGREGYKVLMSRAL